MAQVPPLPDSFHLDPDQSIRDRFEVLSDAILVPASRNRSWAVEAGLFDKEGHPHPLSQGWHYEGNPATKFPALPATISGTCSGRFLFLGHYTPHFGHFLLETTARLWHLHQCPADYDGAVLLHQPQEDRGRIERDLGRFMALCGWEMPPLLWADIPVRLEQVVVPMQGSGALQLMQASPEYRDMIHSRFARDIAPRGADKIYLSRTAFDHRHGSLIEEAKLERLLAGEGFHIYHPQEHGLEEQVAQYKAARVIAGVDGSAFHLLALVVRPHQKVVIFQRRPAPEVQMQAEQLRRYGAGEVRVLAAAPTAWSPAGVRRSALSVFGVTAFPAAGQALSKMGVISRPELWTDTPQDELRKHIRRIGRSLGADMYEVRKPGESLAHLPLRSDRSRIRLFPRTRWRGGG